jgi:hypothetical protein
VSIVGIIPRCLAERITGCYHPPCMARMSGGSAPCARSIARVDGNTLLDVKPEYPRGIASAKKENGR